MKTYKYKLVWLSIVILSLPTIVQAVERPSDTDINYWVREALREDPRIYIADINTSTSDGIVTLSGSTRTLAEKNFANLEAKKIQGVRSVINELTVKPEYRYDADITQDIRYRLTYNAYIKTNDIGVSVVDGKVTLTGKVKSWAERQEAELLASEVRGVKDVNDQLEVEYQTTRSDKEIEMDVVAAIHRNVFLTGLPIHVSVQDGSVFLSGEVGNAYQKYLAYDCCRWINNVKSVVNNIEVKWWEEHGVREKAEIQSNEQLQKTVHDALYQDLRVEPYDVTVKATSGHVVLRGMVPSYHQKQIADQDAREVVGVAWVSNLLTVRTAPRSDYSILRDIQSAIGSDYSLNGQDIQVRVQNGKVTLTGNVNEKYERAHATTVAGKIRGVWDVVNKIKVNWYPKFTDTELQQRIKDRLKSHDETRWIADQIKIVVKNGKATLTGKVYSWSERKEAGHITSTTDGIWSVNNKLRIADVNYPWDDWDDVYPYMP